MERVAQHFGGTWEPGEDPPDAYLSLDGREIAVEVTTLTQQVAGPRGEMVPRRSYDTPVLDLVDKLEAAVRPRVKDGRYVVLALRAPLHNLRALRVELEGRVVEALETEGDVNTKLTIGEDEVDVISHAGARPSGKVIVGAVFNRLSTPNIGFNAATILRERIESKSKIMRSAAPGQVCWLALLNDYTLADADTYRGVLRGTPMDHPFERVLLIRPDGRVEDLLDPG